MRSTNRPETSPQETTLHDVRQAFQVGLNKIANAQTREIVINLFLHYHEIMKNYLFINQNNTLTYIGFKRNSGNNYD